MQVTLRLRYSVHVADCLLHYSTSHASNSAFVDNITFLQHWPTGLNAVLSSFTIRVKIHNSSMGIFFPASWQALFIILPLQGFGYHQLALAVG